MSANTRSTPEQRFWTKVDKSDSCWLWTACVLWDGYGAFPSGGKRNGRAHRYSWELHHGPIPDGQCVLHTCDERRCVNPAHLFLGTKKDNTADMCRKRRQARGERHGRRKLTAEDVKTIRATAATRRPAQLAQDWSISSSHVYQLLTRRNWKHV